MMSKRYTCCYLLIALFFLPTATNAQDGQRFRAISLGFRNLEVMDDDDDFSADEPYAVAIQFRVRYANNGTEVPGTRRVTKPLGSQNNLYYINRNDDWASEDGGPYLLRSGYDRAIEDVLPADQPGWFMGMFLIYLEEDGWQSWMIEALADQLVQTVDTMLRPGSDPTSFTDGFKSALKEITDRASTSEIIGAAITPDDFGGVRLVLAATTPGFDPDLLDLVPGGQNALPRQTLNDLFNAVQTGASVAEIQQILDDAALTPQQAAVLLASLATPEDANVLMYAGNLPGNDEWQDVQDVVRNPNFNSLAALQDLGEVVATLEQLGDVELNVTGRQDFAFEFPDNRDPVYRILDQLGDAAYIARYSGHSKLNGWVRVADVPDATTTLRSMPTEQRIHGAWDVTYDATRGRLFLYTLPGGDSGRLGTFYPLGSAGQLDFNGARRVIGNLELSHARDRNRLVMHFNDDEQPSHVAKGREYRYYLFTSGEGSDEMSSPPGYGNGYARKAGFLTEVPNTPVYLTSGANLIPGPEHYPGRWRLVYNGEERILHIDLAETTFGVRDYAERNNTTPLHAWFEDEPDRDMWLHVSRDDPSRVSLNVVEPPSDVYPKWVTLAGAGLELEPTVVAGTDLSSGARYHGFYMVRLEHTPTPPPPPPVEYDTSGLARDEFDLTKSYVKVTVFNLETGVREPAEGAKVTFLPDGGSQGVFLTTASNGVVFLYLSKGKHQISAEWNGRRSGTREVEIQGDQTEVVLLIGLPPSVLDQLDTYPADLGIGPASDLSTAVGPAKRFEVRVFAAGQDTAPLESAKVEVRATDGIVWSGDSGPRGQFNGKLNSGNYELIVTKSGYRPSRTTLRATADFITHDVYLTEALHDGDSAADKSSLGQSVTGVVFGRDERGARYDTLADAELLWTSDDGQSRSTRSSSAGKFQINVPPGVYRVVGRATGYVSHAEEVTVTAGMRQVVMRLERVGDPDAGLSSGISITPDLPSTIPTETHIKDQSPDRPGIVPDIPTSTDVEQAGTSVPSRGNPASAGPQPEPPKPDPISTVRGHVLVRSPSGHRGYAAVGSARIDWIDSSGVQRAESSSDAGGRFAVNLRPGKYRARVRAPKGYLDKTFTVFAGPQPEPPKGPNPLAGGLQRARGDAPLRLVLARDVTEDRRSGTVTFLPPENRKVSLSIYVGTRPAGRTQVSPLAGARVSVMARDWKVATQRTSADGLVKLELMPGPYRVQVAHDGYQPSTKEVTLSSTRREVRLTLQPKQTPGLPVKIQVATAIGTSGKRPLPGAKVKITQQGRQVAFGKTDHQGIFRASLSPNATYQVHAEANPVLRLNRATNTFRLKKAYETTIVLQSSASRPTGTVVNSAGSDQQSKVSISGKVIAEFSKIYGEAQLLDRNLKLLRKSMVGSNGRYTFGGLKRGIYYIKLHRNPDEFYNTIDQDTRRVDATRRSVENVNFTLR